MIDWSKLEPYGRSQFRSFEELCYQIAKGLYGDQGKFTSIDDSGGGDGVEFYMTLPNGDQWGWQAKFYYPNLRLSVSNRKTSIGNSLIRACQNHSRLKKWFLCTPTNLTTSEQTWFENELPQSIHSEMHIELEHWGDRKFNEWLSESRFSGKKNYFFGELELTFDWFRTQVGKQTASLKDKFNPLLHTETHADGKIHALLGDNAFVLIISEILTDIENGLDEYKDAVKKLDVLKPPLIGWDSYKSNLLIAINSLQRDLENLSSEVQLVHGLLSEQKLDEIGSSDWKSIWDQIVQKYSEYRDKVSALDLSRLEYDGELNDRKRILDETLHVLEQPYHLAGYLLDGPLWRAVEWLSYFNQRDSHILGTAGVGKTHVVSHICHERLRENLPTLLVLGGHFTSDQPLQRQLLNILDIPASYSWNDFLKALDAVAQTYHIRIPLVIDGLNEATRNGVFSDVWRLGLPGLISEITQTKNVVLITTCRETYKDAIWPKNGPNNVGYVTGFTNYEVQQAVEKYFSWYKIKADLTAAPLSQFRHPIYLRIFCETQNAERQEEKHIYIGENTLFEVFDDYLEQCNHAICQRCGLYFGTHLVIQALNDMAQYLWEQHSRYIPLTRLVGIIDGEPIDTLNWPMSKTKAIQDEGLLACRDWQEDKDVVCFTYDLLGGYLIARYLIRREADNLEAFIRSEDTIKTLFSDDHRTLHPLYNDIGRALAVLLPVQTGKYLHELTDNKVAVSLSIFSLFEIPPDKVKESCVALISKLFDASENRKTLLELAASTVGHVDHPLNAEFWSEQLQKLSMSERDITWTEYVRENVKRFETMLAHFETLCQSKNGLSAVTIERLNLLAEHIMWLLTSTVRPLRDKATRALYWYGRRMPKQFFDLVLSSFEFNDPYVPERMLAATYGVAMAKQYDFDDQSFTYDIQPVYGRKLHDIMFKPRAPHATTHILARDYARRTIDIALIHHPNLLTSEEQNRIKPPFTDGDIREWGASEDRNEDEYRDGNAPIQRDFGNYTLGRLVKDRENYDFEHEEYKRVRANIFWRIYDLGYALEKFGEIDKWIARENWTFGRDRNGGKTDRYGKKYSWIAFYELCGFRKDQNLLFKWYGEEVRIADADIDPSFPQPLQEFKVVDQDLLGDRTTLLHKWIENGGTPDISSYFILEELCGEKGPWVLLDGHVSQEDLEAKRSCFIFPRGFFVQTEDFAELLGLLKEQDHRPLPEIPEDHYTYAGEIPWCDNFPYNGQDELSFVLTTRKKKVVISSPVINGENIVFEQKEQEVEEPDKTRVFYAFIPVRYNEWESSHSSVNPSQAVLVPAKEIAEFLDLCSQPQTFDLYEKNGDRASFTIRWGEPWHTNHQLIFLRQDLLDRYLQENNLRLIWVVWGERQFKSERNEGLEDFTKEHLPYKAFREIKSYGDIRN